MKTFGLSKDQVLWEYSWLNLVMMCAPYSDTDEKETKKPELKELQPDDFAKFFGVKERKQ